MLQVSPISAFKDNYIWLIHTAVNHQCVVVDPGDATPVRQHLQEYNLALSAVLITHHHHDHSGGISELLRHYPHIPVYGPAAEDIAGVTHPVNETQQVSIPALNLQLQVLDIPGHTRGHIAFAGHELVFCGDTLFAAGCGRLFEGTAAQMVASLAKLSALSDTTEIYCGHEYTLSNLKFAQAVEPQNTDIAQRLAQAQKLRQQNLVTLPSSIAFEKKTNPFLRCDIPAVKVAAQTYAKRPLATKTDVFSTLREWKNNF